LTEGTDQVTAIRSVNQSTYCLVTWSNGLRTAVRTLSEVPVTSRQKATGPITAVHTVCLRQAARYCNTRTEVQYLLNSD